MSNTSLLNNDIGFILESESDTGQKHARSHAIHVIVNIVSNNRTRPFGNNLTTAKIIVTYTNNEILGHLKASAHLVGKAEGGLVLHECCG